MSKHIGLLAALLVGLLLWRVAAAGWVVAVHVDADSDDNVGSRLVYAIKEGIRRSAGLSYTDDPDHAAIGISIITGDPEKKGDGGGTRTVYSIVFSRTQHNSITSDFLGHILGVCGIDRVASCADGIVADTDKFASKYVLSRGSK